MLQRQIENVSEHPLEPGFMGKGHKAAEIVGYQDFKDTDPFLLLMDDQMYLPGTHAAGGPHPHAGFETVSLVLDSDADILKPGLMLMTAGKGIVHMDAITQKLNVRLLQCWLVLPPEKRWAQPFYQEIDLATVPKIKDETGEIRVYSGSAYGLTSPIKNNTPINVLEFNLVPNAESTYKVPASYNGFIFVLEGSVFVGDTEVKKGESGWMTKTGQKGDSEITFKAGDAGAHFVCYAGEPQNAPVVHYGPFIGDTQDDIRRLIDEYNDGKMKHVKYLPEQFVKRYTSDKK